MDMERTAIAVKSVTGAYTAVGAVGTFLASVLGLIGLWVKFGPNWRKVAVSADERFRDDLLKRLAKLERTLELERARHEAERSLDRHKLNNMSQCFDAVMLMLEAAPEKAAEIVAKIKLMRAAQIQTEALEKAAIHAAEIATKGELEGLDG
jgi:hypothetical protein